MIVITTLLGLLLLPSIGLAQWWVLRRHIRRAGLWVWANALAWLGGLAVPFVGLALVPDDSPLGVWIAVGALCGLLLGAVVGAITGLALLRLLRRASDGLT